MAPTNVARRSTEAPLDTKYLRSLLTRTLMASLASPVMLGCSSSSTEPIAPGDVDATPAHEADAGGDAACTANTCADAAATDAYVTIVDAYVADTYVNDAGPCAPSPSMCPYELPLSCSDASVTRDDAGALSVDACTAACGQAVAYCDLSADGGASVTCVSYSCGGGKGRRPSGLREPSCARAGGSRVGRYFAESARLEAASVVAFRVMREELELHRAPRALRTKAMRAGRDEVRHTRAMARLARAWGARVPALEVRASGPRSLEAIAIENIAEGCVRETFGAIVAMHQAKAATDARVRDAMKTIAKDEVAHAALAWELASWIDAKLDASSRERVAQAKRAAVDALHRETAIEPPADLRRVAGLPNARRAGEMMRALEASLWA